MRLGMAECHAEATLPVCAGAHEAVASRQQPHILRQCWSKVNKQPLTGPWVGRCSAMADAASALASLSLHRRQSKLHASPPTTQQPRACRLPMLVWSRHLRRCTRGIDAQYWTATHVIAHCTLQAYIMKLSCAICRVGVMWLTTTWPPAGRPVLSHQAQYRNSPAG